MVHKGIVVFRTTDRRNKGSLQSLYSKGARATVASLTVCVDTLAVSGPLFLTVHAHWSLAPDRQLTMYLTLLTYAEHQVGPDAVLKPTCQALPQSFLQRLEDKSR